MTAATPCHAQALRRWQRFGYGHALLVFPERGPCDRLQRSGAFAKLACGWWGRGVGLRAGDWGSLAQSARRRRGIQRHWRLRTDHTEQGCCAP